MTNCLLLASIALRRALPAALFFLLGLPAAHAFDKLSEAQTLVYSHPHLSNTINGQTVEYQYLAQSSDADEIQDLATLTINETEAGDEMRNVVVDFLSSERHMPLPPFDGYRGNPIIIAMLEHISQSMGSETGGGALYFRNRIRDALASDKIVMEDTLSQFNDKQVAATTLSFSPFLNDGYLKGNPLISNAEFKIELSDSVPAGVIAISVKGQHEEQSFNRRLSVKP